MYGPKSSHSEVYCNITVLEKLKNICNECLFFLEVLDWFLYDNGLRHKRVNGDTRAMCEISSELIIKTPERRAFYTDFTHFSNVSILHFEEVNVDWVWGD